MNIIVLYSCLSVFSHFRYTLRLLLSICDLVKLHVAFFSVLPFTVNTDEYIMLSHKQEDKVVDYACDRAATRIGFVRQAP